MEIIILSYYLIAILYAIYSFTKYSISPNLIFILSQTIMMTGVLDYVDYSYDSDKKLVWIYIIVQIMFIFGTEFAYLLRPITYKDARISKIEMLDKYQKKIIWLMVIVSILACTYLFVKSNTNVFLQIVKSMMSSTTGNYTESRLSINKVAGVGYIYQFRVIILPILSAYLLTVSEGIERKIASMIFLVMIIFILGTGQRGGFVMFVLMWLLSLVIINKLYRMNMTKTILKIVILFIIIFAIMTLYNGRAEKTGSVIGAMVGRILGDNQECAVLGFRYIVNQPTQWGMDWLLSLADILPGKSGYVQLSYIIFDVMYGSTRGTAPPDIWGSVYYNWNMIGIVIFPFILGIAYYNIYHRLCSKVITKLRIFIYSGMFIILGMWIADNPMVLFNQGFITMYILMIILKIDKIRIKCNVENYIQKQNYIVK